MKKSLFTLLTIFLSLASFGQKHHDSGAGIKGRNHKKEKETSKAIVKKSHDLKVKSPAPDKSANTVKHGVKKQGTDRRAQNEQSSSSGDVGGKYLEKGRQEEKTKTRKSVVHQVGHQI